MSTIAFLRDDEATKFYKVNWDCIQYYQNVKWRKNPDGTYDETYSYRREER